MPKEEDRSSRKNTNTPEGLEDEELPIPGSSFGGVEWMMFGVPKKHHQLRVQTAPELEDAGIMMGLAKGDSFQMPFVASISWISGVNFTPEVEFRRLVHLKVGSQKEIRSQGDPELWKG